MGDMLSGITVNAEIDPAKNFTDQITLAKPRGYQVTYNGTDYEQVIDADGTIYQPIVDTKVKASFKVVDEKTKAYSFREVEVTVPGSMKGSEQGEAAPVILPECVNGRAARVDSPPLPASPTRTPPLKRWPSSSPRTTKRSPAAA